MGHPVDTYYYFRFFESVSVVMMKGSGHAYIFYFILSSKNIELQTRDHAAVEMDVGREDVFIHLQINAQLKNAWNTK